MKSLVVGMALLVGLAGAAAGAIAKLPAEKKLHAFAAPGKKWSLAMDLTGYTVEQDDLDKKAQKRYVLTNNKKSGVTVSFWIEPLEKDMDSRACREVAWAKELKTPFKKEDIKMWEEGNLAVVEYVVDVPGSTAHNLQQKNYRAYLTHERAWVDIHISFMMPGTDQADEARIKKLLKSVRIEKGDKDRKPEGESRPEALLDLATAIRWYKQKNYARAATYFQKVFDAEKKKRTLDQAMWRAMVDQLGMCYGMTGKLEKAKEVFEYGINEDPKYPMFHYNLACAYAEMGDLDRLLSSLESAIKYRANMNKYEKFPDPRNDSSFAKYFKNKRFQEIVQELDQ